MVHEGLVETEESSSRYRMHINQRAYGMTETGNLFIEPVHTGWGIRIAHEGIAEIPHVMDALQTIQVTAHAIGKAFVGGIATGP